MATSGTINGTVSGTRPYLRLNWSRIETDVGGNRSKLRLQLYLMHPYRVNYSAAKSGVLQGSSFSSSIAVSGTGSTLLRSQEIWVGHNADGSKTQSLSASYNINITYSSTWMGQLTVSGNAAIDSIPRGSTLSAFSFASSLQIGTANTINYTIKRHSDNFRHQVQLRDGSVTIATWDNQSSNGSATLPLTGAQVNTILGRMSTVTSKSFTLSVSTRSGVNGGWIGSSVTRDASVSVNANVTPQVISTSATPIGNSWAVGKGFYVQGQTGVQADFSSNARGGAGVKSRSISIGSLSSGGSVVGSVFRHSQSRVNSSGDITITYTITDTRNRTASDKRTVNFRAYTPPQITSFTVGRSSPTSPTVNIKSQGSIHGIGGQNTGTMTMTQQGVSGNVRSISLTNTTPTFNDSFNREIATSSSADFTITVTDLLGNSATSTSTVGTAFMEFSIRKGTGVGIGKVHERGVLDVDGEVYMNGKVMALGGLGFEDTRNVNEQPQEIPGRAFSFAFKNASTIDSPPERAHNTYAHILNIAGWNSSEGSGGYPLQMSIGRYGISLRQGISTTAWSDWNSLGYTANGQNNNGDWYRFSNGLQICITVFTANFSNIGQTVYVNLPKEFNSPYYTGFVGGAGNAWLEIEQSSSVGVGPGSATQARVQVYNSTYHARGDAVGTYRLITMGRWK